MKRGKFFKRSLLLLILAIFLVFISIKFVESQLESKIYAELRNVHDLTIEREDINVDIINSGLELRRIKVHSDPKKVGFQWAIGSVKLAGINLIKAVTRHEYYADNLIISRSRFTAKIPFPKAVSPKISQFTIGIGSILIDQLDLELEDPDGQSYYVRRGLLRLDGVQISKMDTVSLHIFNPLDLQAEEFRMTPSGKLYKYSLKGISYSAAMKILSVDSLLIIPGYKDYDFTSRFKFQKNCIEASLLKINVHDLSFDNYFRPRILESSYVEIGEMNMKIFRDKRKEFLHKKKPAFQDMIYNIPSVISVDSISLLKGKIIYKVHGEEAKEPGMLTVNEIRARLLNLTNDTVYKRKTGFLELKADARLMETGKMAILMRGKLFDKNNTLKIDGSVSGLYVNELNPFLEKNAFMYASGRIDDMNLALLQTTLKRQAK